MRPWLFPVCNAGFRTTLWAFSDLQVEGRENIPRSGPAILASNHLSNVDPPLLASLAPSPPAFLAKKELFKFPLNLFLAPYGAYPLDRSKADMKAIAWAKEQLKAGRPVLVFPEGTRSRGQGLLKAKAGAALLAIETGAPIVPIGLTGSEKLQNLLRLLMPSATLRVRIGEPFIVKPEFRTAERRVLLGVTQELMDRIARLLPEEYRGEYSGLRDAPYEFTEGAVQTASQRAG